MKKEEFISPFVLLVAFSVILAVWITIYLHASFQHPHFHFVEKMMFSSYFTILGCIALTMGFGMFFLVYSGVLWTMKKLTGVEHEKGCL